MSWSVFSEENFKKVVEHAPVGIVIIDRELKWQFVNGRFCEITGYSRDELAGKTFLDITYKEDIGRNLNLYNKLLNGEVNEYYYEKRYVRKTGEIIWVRLAVAGVRIGNEYSHMVVSVQDIDASKKNQQMLEMRNEELDTLLYKASHDLRAPVTTLAGLCNLLILEHDFLQQSETFRHLDDTIQRLKKQNDSLLQLTQIQEWSPVSQQISLSTLVEGVLTDMDVPVSSVQIDSTGVEITTDGNLLLLALRPILENALAYRREDRDLEIHVSYECMDGQHRITIKDNGQGIPDKELEHIMGMFHRASVQSHGSGLGLYIARKAIEKLRGVIHAESAEGEGSVFQLYFPF